MPSKTGAVSPDKGTGFSNEVFLMLCFKAAKDKIRIDFNRVAAELGMSSGGAANKFRNMMKAAEAENPILLSNHTSPAPASTKKATGTKRKATARSGTFSKTDAKAAEDDEDSGTFDSEFDETPTKKSRGRKGTAKPSARKVNSPKKDSPLPENEPTDNSVYEVGDVKDANIKSPKMEDGEEQGVKVEDGEEDGVKEEDDEEIVV